MFHSFFFTPEWEAGKGRRGCRLHYLYNADKIDGGNSNKAVFLCRDRSLVLEVWWKEQGG